MGKDVREALQAAIFLEETAKILIMARVIGEPQPIPEKIAKVLHKNYIEKYGQKRR